MARVTLMRAALSVLRSFCAVEANKNILLEWGLVQQLVDGGFHIYDDRKTRRIASDILKHMAATEDGLSLYFVLRQRFLARLRNSTFISRRYLDLVLPDHQAKVVLDRPS